MQTKQTNLVLSADVTTKQELYSLIEQVGEHVCCIKFHIDILRDFDKTVPEQLCCYAKKYNVLLFEDRKFTDIGKTVQEQFGRGTFEIARWADIINANILPGEAIIPALKQAQIKETGLLLIGQMSSKGNMIDQNYTTKTIELAEKYSDFVMGFICQEQLTNNPNLLHITPGVNLASKEDTLGQQYNSPEYVIGTKGTDLIIVGRGITQAENPILAAQNYKDAAWKAYMQRK